MALGSSPGRALVFISSTGGTEKGALEEKAAQCNISIFFFFWFLALWRQLCPHENQNCPQPKARPQIVALID